LDPREPVLSSISARVYLRKVHPSKSRTFSDGREELFEKSKFFKVSSRNLKENEWRENRGDESWIGRTIEFGWSSKS
jgi:hypothetical protein